MKETKFLSPKTEGGKCTASRRVPGGVWENHISMTMYNV